MKKFVFLLMLSFVGFTFHAAAINPFDSLKVYSVAGKDTFTTNATDTVVLIKMWGGGGGGGNANVGGGGGGYGEQILYLHAHTPYIFYVGAGGAGKQAVSGGNGGITKFFILPTDSIYATGGSGAGIGGTSNAVFRVTGQSYAVDKGGDGALGGTGGLNGFFGGVQPAGGGGANVGTYKTGFNGAAGEVIIYY